MCFKNIVTLVLFFTIKKKKFLIFLRLKYLQQKWKKKKKLQGQCYKVLSDSGKLIGNKCA